MKRPGAPLKPWSAKMSNGCTLFPQGNWRSCCVKHDRKYYYGGTRMMKLRADLDLMKCIAHKGHPIMGLIAFIGITLFGGPYWTHKARWNRGHKYKDSFYYFD